MRTWIRTSGLALFGIGCALGIAGLWTAEQAAAESPEGVDLEAEGVSPLPAPRPASPKPNGRFSRQIILIEEPVGVPNYAFEERLQDGQKRDLAIVDFRGRVVLLNFWASWCGVCAREMPKLDRLASSFRDDGIDVLALSLDDTIEKAAGTLSKRGHDNLRVFRDTESVLSAMLGVRGVPTTFVIGPDGKALAVVQGPADWESKEALDWLRGLTPPRT